VLRWSREREVLRIVEDQVGSPTWARMLAEATSLLLAKALAMDEDWLAERRGLYHLGGSGACSRFAWAQEILRLDPRREEQVADSVEPVGGEAFPTPAARPAYSALDCARFADAFGLSLPGWAEALAMAMGSGSP
jgi:dTDP-4-dehydrorhamnose reductase